MSVVPGERGQVLAVRSMVGGGGHYVICECEINGKGQRGLIMIMMSRELPSEQGKERKGKERKGAKGGGWFVALVCGS